MQVRGGPLFRFVERQGSGDLLVTLGVEATLGAAVDGLTTSASQTSVVGGVSVTVGAMSIGPFHF